MSVDSQVIYAMIDVISLPSNAPEYEISKLSGTRCRLPRIGAVADFRYGIPVCYHDHRRLKFVTMGLAKWVATGTTP
jgi:hypothetical protein